MGKKESSLETMKIVMKVSNNDHSKLAKKKGKLTWEQFGKFLIKNSPTPCQACKGEGSISNGNGTDSCKQCGGSGKYK